MKRYALILAAAVALTGCAMVPSKFDNVGYNNLVALKMEAVYSERQCNQASFKDSLQRLNNVAQHNRIYIDNTREDEQLKASIKLVETQIADLIEDYKLEHTAVYCTLQMKNINDSVDAIVSAVGGRQR